MHTQEAGTFCDASQQGQLKCVTAMLSHLSQQCWLQELQPQPELPQMCSVQLTTAVYAVAAPDELCYGSSLAALSILLYEIWLALPSQPSK